MTAITGIVATGPAIALMQNDASRVAARRAEMLEVHIGSADEIEGR